VRLIEELLLGKADNANRNFNGVVGLRAAIFTRSPLDSIHRRLENRPRLTLLSVCATTWRRAHGFQEHCSNFFLVRDWLSWEGHSAASTIWTRQFRPALGFAWDIFWKGQKKRLFGADIL